MAHPHLGEAMRRQNRRGTVRGRTDLIASQVFVPVQVSKQVASLAWRDGKTKQEWLLEAVTEKLERSM